MNVQIQDKKDEWALAHDGGMWLVGVAEAHIGDPGSRPARLAQVLQFNMQVVQQRDGRVGIAHGAQPLLMLPGLDTWELSPSAVLWRVAGHPAEGTIRQAIAQGEQLVAEMRAQAAGLQLVKTMPRVK